MANKAIQALMNSGADAFSNMYELYITPPGSSDESVMTVRASSFKIPEAAIETYDKKYHGNAIKAAKPSINFERKFTVQFRADAQYNLHDLFVKWHGMIANPVTGGVSNTTSHAEGKVRVNTLASAYIAMKDQSYSVYGASNDKNFGGDMGEIASSCSNDTDGIRGWVFENVWPEKVGQFEYKTDSADALQFSVDFIFGETDYPAYNEI